MLFFVFHLRRRHNPSVRRDLVSFTEPIQLWGLFVLQRGGLDFAWAQQAASIPVRALVCQQGIGAGGRRCGAAWGVHGGSLPPAPCVNLRPWWEHAGDGCWALCPWLCCDRAPTADVLLKKHYLAPIKWYMWGHACTHVLVPRWHARVHLYGSRQTHLCRSHKHRCHRCLQAGHRSPWTGSSGQRGGPSHLSLPEAGARDSNGAFRLVRASYCRWERWLAR